MQCFIWRFQLYFIRDGKIEERHEPLRILLLSVTERFYFRNYEIIYSLTITYGAIYRQITFMVQI